MYVYPVLSTTIPIFTPSTQLFYRQTLLNKNPIIKHYLFGDDFKQELNRYMPKIVKDKTIGTDVGISKYEGLPCFDEGALNPLYRGRNAHGYSLIELPKYSNLVNDCGKM